MDKIFWNTPPATDAHVWTAPRAVEAAAVRTMDGEAEKFLFYRGVGHIDAPLRISRDDPAQELVLRSQLAPGIGGDRGLPVGSLWLVDIRADGSVAFRDIPPVSLAGSGNVVARIPSLFPPADYSAGNLERLQESLGAALVAAGLFGDEARALLNTWELSYFKSAGLRLFFIVPRAWTDSHLPLDVSAPAEIDRVMVGRIELVTPAQRGLLRQIGLMTRENLEADAGLLRTNCNGSILRNLNGAPARAEGGGLLQEVNSGAMTLEQFGVAVPRSYELYLRLGRFRNALLLDEAARRPTAGLTAFISQYDLAAYQPEVLSGDTLSRADGEAVVRSPVP
ncbi:MAG: hypothetical protein ABSA47_14380 [Verrucomicrobiota bacterium]